MNESETTGRGMNGESSTVPAAQRAELPPILNGQRLLPLHLVPGYTLTAEDLDELQRLLRFHYEWVGIFQEFKAATDRELYNRFLYIQELQKYVRAPVTGYVFQEGTLEGLYPDGWAAPVLQIRLRPLEPVVRILVRGWRPTGSGSTSMKVVLNDAEVLTAAVSEGLFEIAIPLPDLVTVPFALRVECDSTYKAGANGGSEDSRGLAFVLSEIRIEHARAEGSTVGLVSG
jgi:hypothetical protein